mmetsp:Transcript_27407/g.70429  ORF Transcript_27407/g.70429 Transcript_27407/m.70429 type:complete len:208 (+) Transcript_27407:2463-3086(+)
MPGQYWWERYGPHHRCRSIHHLSAQRRRAVAGWRLPPLLLLLLPRCGAASSPVASRCCLGRRRHRVQSAVLLSMLLPAQCKNHPYHHRCPACFGGGHCPPGQHAHVSAGLQDAHCRPLGMFQRPVVNPCSCRGVQQLDYFSRWKSRQSYCHRHLHSRHQLPRQRAFALSTLEAWAPGHRRLHAWPCAMADAAPAAGPHTKAPPPDGC